MPDVSYNDQLVYPVGSQLDRSTVKSGQVHGLIDLPHGTAAPANH
jgi:hypothetical protein